MNGDSMEKTDSKTIVVCDAGPVIQLDEIGCLYVMKDFAKVIVSTGVCREVLRHRPVTFKEPEVSWQVVPPRFPLEKAVQTMCGIFSLDAREMEALSLLKEETGSLFLTDDAAARLVATNLGFRVHGTIGVLVRTIRRDLMKPKEVVDALNRLPLESTLYIKPSLLEEVVLRIKKEFNL